LTAVDPKALFLGGKRVECKDEETELFGDWSKCYGRQKTTTTETAVAVVVEYDFCPPDRHLAGVDFQ
jgi:hypothetical protein